MTDAKPPTPPPGRPARLLLSDGLPRLLRGPVRLGRQLTGRRVSGRSARRAVVPTLIAVSTALLAAIVAVGGTAYAATLFSDDFEDGNSTGWTTSGGTWSVTTDGSRVLRQTG